MHVIIDYGVGNILSVSEGFKRAGIATIVSKDEDIIRNCTSLILPGVGAFKDAIDALYATGLVPAIMDHIKSDKMLLGICLGMQLLYEESHEDGIHQGLGVFKGTVEKLPDGLKVPHMGWNSLEIKKIGNPIVKQIKEGEHVYFVHSYICKTREENVIATVSYGITVPAIVWKGSVIGMQFHPEKSGETGLNILRAYKELLT